MNKKRLEDLGEKIKILQTVNSLSVDQMCEAMGITPKTFRVRIRKPETMTIDELFKVSSLFNLSIPDILDFPGKKRYTDLLNGNGGGDSDDGVENRAVSGRIYLPIDRQGHAGGSSAARFRRIR